jgi:RHH-type proline utilization regulon transcriptional repressor/proline dehydrogenase/delta 1-pyrroline-5-carboxylate dehydrogenase
VEQQVSAWGERLLACANRARQHGQGWIDQLMARTMVDENFRIQALRFVDVLPALDDDRALARHLQEYFGDLELPELAGWGLKHSNAPWASRIAAPTVRYTLRGLARKFMGGSQLHHALTSINRLRHQGMNFTLDLLGEATISEAEADRYQQDYLQMIDRLSTPLGNWHQDDLLDRSNGRPSPRMNVSLKVSSLYSQINGADPQGSIRAIGERLRPILRRAREQQAFVTLDMEQYDFKHLVLQCFKQVMMEPEFRDWTEVGIAIQAYLRDSYEDLTELIDWVKQRAAPVTVRLVRGAYWDFETVIARQQDWPCPVWQQKCDTDANYERCIKLLFDNHPHVEAAIAGHNYRSIAYTMALAEHIGLSSQQFEFQMLYGMADHLKQALVELGYRLRIYVPYGETLPGMAYLVRRLLENSSGQNILDFGLVEDRQSIDFSAPRFSEDATGLASKNRQHFRNMALLRFTEDKQRQQYAAAIGQVRSELGKSYTLNINNQSLQGEELIESRNPARPDEIIGRVSGASPAQADIALEAASAAFPGWSRLPARQRGDYLRRVAGLLKKRRMEFAAWQILEAGKNWREADADICEAIDFLNFYAEQAERIAEPSIKEFSGEHNQYYHHPRGVGLVIPPWNFPLAILTGMLSATIVSGNTAILKPSSLTPVIAAKFIELFQQVDLPPGVVNYLPGSGRRVGEYLARKAEVSIIAFTGSQQVGSQLLQIGAQMQPGQHHIKRVIAEMGGKNALIIDRDADLDDAILGTLHSAFGFQGQKCSAASRVIVVGDIHDHFVERLTQAARSLSMGSPEAPGNFMGPVIDEQAYSNILQAIVNGKQAGELALFDEQRALADGYYIPPAIFTNVDPDSPLAQEEIFGPVLSVLKADDFDQAIQLANHSRYALTGGLYSRQPSHLEKARREFRVGNLYLNRRITGALVSRQPFGGFKMSGVGAKAGSDDYLLQFMDAACVTENTLRRGFAPKVDDE